MKAQQQCKLLQRICRNLEDANLAAGQLPDSQPLRDKLHAAWMLATAWLSDQEADLPCVDDESELPAATEPRAYIV